MKTTVIKHTAFLLILAGNLSSCSEKLKSDIDTEINIRMVETFDVSPRVLQFYFSTTKIYPCTGYSIGMLCQQSSNIIDISFKGVYEPEICRNSPWYAIGGINLGALSNGTYHLNLYNGEVKHSGELIVSSDSYKVKFVNNPNFRFTNAPLYKIPENTIWGLVGYHKSGSISLVQSFLAELMNLGAEEKSYTPGTYDRFVINKEGNITYPDALWGYYFDQPFIFYYAGSITDLEQLVIKYAHDYGEHISITVNTDKGSVLYSYIYQ